LQNSSLILFSLEIIMRLALCLIIPAMVAVSACANTAEKNTTDKTLLNSESQNSGQMSGETIEVFKFAGTVQCQRGGGISRADMENQLTKAGITVSDSTCGNDGKMRITVCGAPDGKLFIFEIPATQTETARSLGFAPLSNLPSANKMPCQN
jgi:hypothetical protein